MKDSTRIRIKDFLRAIDRWLLIYHLYKFRDFIKIYNLIEKFEPEESRHSCSSCTVSRTENESDDKLS